ncbi:MAG TPA: DUF1643 domain-containing protein [Prosthecobacter sp.]
MNTRNTIISPCGLYRYTLWRDWRHEPSPLCRDCADFGPTCPHSGGPCDTSKYVVFIGLNPSTADATKDDHTVRKCIGFAKQWGYRSMCIVNLFAFRATQPSDLFKATNPIGPGNNYHFLSVISDADLVIAAWGNQSNPALAARLKTLKRAAIIKLLRTAQCLGYTASGQPLHPSRPGYLTKRVPFSFA